MAIEWTKDLAIGIKEIDDQHKMLYQKVDQLFEACNNRQGSAIIGDMLKFLSDYTKLHFKDEEEYMLSINYPEYENQKELHNNFIAELEKVNRKYIEANNDLIVVLSVNQMIVNWLIYHISIEDKKIGEFARDL